VTDDVDHQVLHQRTPLLGRAPGLSHEATDIGPEHRTRVIEGEDGVKPTLLELPLAHDAAPSAEHRLVGGFRKDLSHDAGITRVGIGGELDVLREVRADLPEESMKRLAAMIRSFSVSFAGNLGQGSFGWHRAGPESQDQAGLLIDYERHADRFTLRMFKGLELIELNPPEGPKRFHGVSEGFLMEGLGLRAQESSLPQDRIPMNAKKPCRPSQRNSRIKQS
jgi:hypothetical protein